MADKKDLYAVKYGDKDKVTIPSLYYACVEGDLEMVRTLVLHYNANVDAYCCKSELEPRKPPLHVAAENGQEEVALALLSEFGAYCNIKDSYGQPVLHYACRGGNVRLVRSLIRKYNADVSARDREDKTPLHVAVENRHEEIALTLIYVFGADCNVNDGNGLSVLHYACNQDNLTLVRALIHEGKADVNVKDDNGQSVLHYACSQGTLTLMRTLIREGKADISAQDREHKTPLHVAAENRHEKIAFALINEFSADCNVKDSSGQSVLHYACHQGTLTLVRILIYEGKADVSARDREDKTPLHVAAENKQEEIAFALINEFGADCNVKDGKGQSVLHYVCSQDTLTLVRTLIHKGKADINIQDNDNKTPLHVAAENGQRDVALALINDFHADCNVKDNNGQSVLHYVCTTEYQETLTLVRTLMHKGKADVNARDSDHKTPIHVAVVNGQEDITLALINDFHADCNVKDGNGQSVLHYVCYQGTLTLVQTLIHEGKADVNARDSNNKTPLHVAAENGQRDVALALINDFHADCNVKDDNGQSVLHYVCTTEYLDTLTLVRTLIHKGKADVNAQDSDHKTPLHVAVQFGQEKISLALINEFGTDCNIRDKWGQSVLHYACRQSQSRLVRTLIYEGKAEVNAQDSDYKTPLHIALQFGQENIALALINEFDANCNIEDKSGQPILHYACRECPASLVLMLIHDGKADVNACDYSKCTPLHVVARNRNGEEVVSALIQSNASLLAADEDGNTPLHQYAKEGWKNCIELLLSVNAPVLIRNHSGKTPYDLAEDEGVQDIFKKHLQENKAKLMLNYNLVRDDSMNKYSGSKHLTRIFVIGDPGAGKSSLIESLKREKFFQALRTVSESSVPPHTAGIIPTVYISKHYGRVLFYDFAGDREYYSSHAAILENLTSSRRGVNIFVIVLDLRIEEESLTSTLHSWLLLIENQNIDVVKPSLVIVGSHKDLVSKRMIKEKINFFEKFEELIHSKFECNFSFFILNCCKPRSKKIKRIQNHFVSLAERSSLYILSVEASILMGLLEKDFSNTTTCSITDLISHIKITGICLPEDPKLLHPFLYELHEIGVLFLIDGSSPEEVQIISNISLLTNKVHKSLFSQEAQDNIAKQCKEKFGFSLNIGLVPEEMLPADITKECLIQLQYCQEIKCEDIGAFPSSPQSSSINQPLLFFPALITSDKSDAMWTTPPGDSYSIGWLAKCADSSHHFSPRFLHVLFLRLVFRFTLPPSHQQTTSRSSLPHNVFQRRCTLWKTGVHWSMEEGVDCMVELVNNSKGVVVITKSDSDLAVKCSNVFCRIIDCVMEAKAEFCHAIMPDYYLLGEADDYLCEDNLFSLHEVERVLASADLECVVGIAGKKQLKRSNFLFLRNLTYWASLFPIDFARVLDYLKDVVKELMDLGHHLNIPRGVLEAVEVAYPRDVERWRREVVRGWMSSSQDPPCWWQLIEALKLMNKNVLAQKIETEHRVHVLLQKELLNEAHHSIKPDKDFLESFSGVVGSKWPSLASLLSLSSSEIEEVKREGQKEDHALCMLKKWVSKGATYGQLYQRLKSIPLFSSVK